MRLDRLLARATGTGRREVRAKLATGVVEVNGVTVLNGRAEVGEFDRVVVDGGVLHDRRAIYLMLNKPAGYVSATVDDEHPTVMELIGDVYGEEALHLAGRLDRASTGLLLLTNDGNWSRELTLPEKEFGKVYLVETAGRSAPRRRMPLRAASTSAMKTSPPRRPNWRCWASGRRG